jgi:hypothetical protein
MRRLVDLILGLGCAVATALLLGLIAQDDVSMTAYMVRVDALSAARLDFRGSRRRLLAQAQEVKTQPCRHLSYVPAPHIAPAAKASNRPKGTPLFANG